MIKHNMNISIELLNNLFTKRFCLPTNIDIYSYENGINRINSCFCGEYNHIACVLQGNPYKHGIINYGINSQPNVEKNIPGVHAEEAALLKLKTLKNRKNLRPINILVIRLSKMNKILLSRPCSNCIYIMETIPQQKGYKIKHIYYSDDNNTIVKTNLNQLKKLDNEKPHLSKFYRRKQLK